MIATRRQASEEAIEEIERLYRLVHSAQQAERFWKRVLTAEDRARLGGDFASALQRDRAPEMLCRLKGLSLERSVIEVAKSLNLLSDTDRSWLLDEIGESQRDDVEAVERAVQSGHLVLTDHPRAAHWEGTAIALDWD